MVGCVCAITFLGATAAAQADGASTVVRVEAPSCAASWFDAAAFSRALSVELVADGVRVDPSGTALLALDVPCLEEADAVVTLTIDDASESVSLVDVPPRVRMRTLALASRDLVGAVLARAAARPPAVAPDPVEVTPAVVAPPVQQAAQLGAPQIIEAETAPEDVTPRQRWLGLAFLARGAWLGLRVVAPSLSIEGEARVVGTPLALWVAIDGLYAVGTDGLGEIRAWSGDARLGARLRVELAPVTVSLGVGALLGYARADGVSNGSGARVGTVDGALVGVDFGLTGQVLVSADVRLILGIGGIGYIVGFEARAEDRPVISFRDVAPWASFGVGIDLPP